MRGGNKRELHRKVAVTAAAGEAQHEATFRHNVTHVARTFRSKSIVAGASSYNTAAPVSTPGVRSGQNLRRCAAPQKSAESTSRVSTTDSLRLWNFYSSSTPCRAAHPVNNATCIC